MLTPMPAKKKTRSSSDEPPEEAIFAGMEILNRGIPPKVTPQEGIRIMQERLAQQERQRALYAPYSKGYHDLERDITDTKQRIAEYQAQLNAGPN